jgi:hypothetical protein
MLLLLIAGRPAIAAEPKPPDFQALAQEIQKLHKEAGAITIVLWFPSQYWEACLANDARVTDAQKKSLVETLRPYTIMALVDMKLGALGTATYTSEGDIRSKAQLVDGKGNTYEPLGEDDIQAATKNVIGAMKPIMAGNMGPMGKNMQILLFPAADRAGQQIADPTSKGALVLKFDGQEYRWKLPLGSLLPAKYCPTCKEHCSGAWDFCPWCGNRLTNAP